jgi:hypothetical protein
MGQTISVKMLNQRNGAVGLYCQTKDSLEYGWTGHKSSSGFSDLLQYCITIGSETTFLSALCVIRSTSYLVWSRTFLLGVGLADLGDFGRYLVKTRDLVRFKNLRQYTTEVCFWDPHGLTAMKQAVLGSGEQRTAVGYPGHQVSGRQVQ